MPHDFNDDQDDESRRRTRRRKPLSITMIEIIDNGDGQVLSITVDE